MKPVQQHRPVIRALVIDDHMMVRDGLKMMLSTLSNSIQFRITEAENGEEGLRKIERQRFDLVIIDYQMPGSSGAEVVRRILRAQPGIRILALSNYDELPYIQHMMDAGAKGFVLKNIEPAEMLIAIKTVLSNRTYYCSEVAVKLIDSNNDKGASAISLKTILTQREQEILHMIAMEYTNDEIARELHVAKRTIDSHRQNLLNKLQVKNTAGLVKIAFRLKLVGLD